MAASNEQSKIVATLNINGKNVPMNAEAFGNYVCSNYRNLNFMWTEQFAHYRTRFLSLLTWITVYEN